MPPVIQTLVRRSELEQATLTDPVSKFRVCQPETLIDTDFEYGLQPTKWETLELVNNIPTFFSRTGDDDIIVSNVTTTNNSFLIVVTTTNNHNLVVGSPIIITGLNSITAEGTFFVIAVNSVTQFVYRGKSKQTYTGSIYDQYSTYLYPARIFQSTQYNLDNIISMETDDAELSKLYVKTLYPHGFSIGTNFMLVNSVGRKRVTFDATLVDPRNTITTTYDIVTTANNTDGAGFTQKRVNPYDWTSKKALYFQPNNVSTVTSYITVSNHGLSTGMDVMYVCPVGDTTVGGLKNYQLYNVVVVDPNNIYLTDISATFTNGFFFRTYSGYFNDNTAWFSSFTPTNTGTITNIANTNSIPGWFYNIQNVSIEITGWFRPNSTGNWSFWFGADDACYGWIGDNAISGYTSGNYQIGVPGIHGYAETGTTISMVSGQYYPVRLQMGQNGGGIEIQFAFAGPGISRRTDGNGFFFTQNVPYSVSAIKKTLTGQGTSTFGNHALLKAFLVNGISQVNDTLTIDMTTANYLDSSLVANSEIAMFSGDFEKTGFGVLSMIPSKSNVSKSGYTKYYIKGNPTVGASNTVIQVSTSPNGSTLNITIDYIQGVTWIVPLSAIAEYDAVFYDNHGLATDDAVSYSVVSGASPGGLINGTTYYIERINNSAFRLKTGTGVAPTIDITSINSGTIRFTKSAPNADANTIYAIGHDLLNGTQVSYSRGTNPIIPGLNEATTYFIINATSDRFALTTVRGSTAAIADITATSTGDTHSVVSSDKATDGSYVIGTVVDNTTFTLEAGFKVPVTTLTVDPRINIIISGNLFYFPDHRMRTGTAVTYNSNGNTAIGGLVTSTKYFAIRVDTAHFRLASSYANAFANTAVNITSYGTGSNHLFGIADVGGELYVDNTITLTNGSTVIQSTSAIDFLSIMRIGDKFRAQIPATTTTFTITSIDTTNDILTLNTNHGLADGAYVFYTSATPAGGLTSNYVYYVRVSGYASNQVALFNTSSDATNGVSRVDITTNTAGNILVRPPGTIYETTIVEVKSSQQIVVSNAPTITTSAAAIILTTGIFPRVDGYTLHRPFDGGVEIIPSMNPDSQIIRQTRKYFRYQSGKGIQISKAVNFSAPTEITSLTRTGNTAYAITRKPHRLVAGVTVIISDVAQLQSGTNYWNGTYQVTSTPDLNIFTFTLASIPPETVAGGFPQFTLQSWVNSRLRVGLFDDQNGLFFEYDGSYLYAIRRNSIKQVPGSCTVTFNNALVQGLGTRYTTNLVVGDMIVIKGQSYKVVNIANDTSIYIQPPYRGANATNVMLTKTQDTKVVQSQWSIDPCDGNGPTKFDLDINKIQMIYIDYSWYGAGKVRFGFKANNGEVRYVHEFVHNNNNTEAYLRSGNLPGRYEVATIGVPSFVPALMHWGTSIIMDGRFDDDKSYLFTGAGNQISYAAGDSLQFVVNIVSLDTTRTYTIFDPTQGKNITAYRITATVYTTIQNIKSGTTLSGTGLQSGTKSVSSPTRATGSSGFIYIDKQPSVVSNSTITAGDVGDFIPSFIPLISIRLSPSVDNGRPGALGSREIVNRMQLILKSIGILTTHDCEVKLLLNSYPFTKSWIRVTPPSLSQLIYHTKGDSISGGTQLFNFRVSGGTPDASGKRYSVSTTTSLEELTTLGNSILGGDDVYPNGPDLLTIGATILEASGISVTTPFTITGRITWTESQA